MRWLHVGVARLCSWLRPGDAEADFDRELDAHLALSAEDKIRQGCSPEEARRLARLELGGVAQLREAGRAARGLPRVDTFWLDVKLGFRMLRRSWGLTLAGGLAMTAAIAIAAGLINVRHVMFGSVVPLAEGDRVVALVTWNARSSATEDPSWQSFSEWRESLGSVEDVSAFRTIRRLLAIADAPAQPVSIAEITASGFDLARVTPLLGRRIVGADEREGATPVVVIGYDVWRRRFASDPGVVGRRVRLGDTLRTVVGVMPEGFAFPVNHRFWTPFPASGVSDADADATVFVFARLAPGVTLEGAQAEVTTIGSPPRESAEEDGAQRRPRVVPYSLAISGNSRDDATGVIRLILFVTALLLVPLAANIAILVYARSVTRQQEFLARHALGASRGRIVGQIFVELLVLSAGAALAALVIVSVAGRYIQGVLNMRYGTPYWFDFGAISIETIAFAAILAAAAAAIAGVVPALRATASITRSGFRGLDRRVGIGLGVTWTVLVVAQVAFSICVLPPAAEMAWGTLRPTVRGPGFDASQYLTARLVQDQGGALFGDLQTELLGRLSNEPGVAGATASAAVPGLDRSAELQVESSGEFEPALVNRIDPAFFDVFPVRLAAGRAFERGDLESGAAIVNRTLAARLAGGASPLGQRFHYSRLPAGFGLNARSSYLIVGVVEDLPANVEQARIYHPLAAGEVRPISLAIRTSPESRLADRLPALLAQLDASVRVENVARLDEVYRRQWRGRYLGAVMVAGVALSVLLLSAAGIYALMSFTVAERRREIGIRSALGAQPTRLVAAIFARAVAQLTVGAGIGVLAAWLLRIYLPIDQLGGRRLPAVIPGAALLLAVAGVVAALGPARRALRIEPSEALRGDG